VWSQDGSWTRTVSEYLRCKCESVSGTEVHLLHITMYCRKMKSVTDRSYTGTQIVYTSAIAALNWKLVFFLNICVYMTLEKHLQRQFMSQGDTYLRLRMYSLILYSGLVLRNLACLIWS